MELTEHHVARREGHVLWLEDGEQHGIACLDETAATDPKENFEAVDLRRRCVDGRDRCIGVRVSVEIAIEELVNLQSRAEATSARALPTRYHGLTWPSLPIPYPLAKMLALRNVMYGKSRTADWIESSPRTN